MLTDDQTISCVCIAVRGTVRVHRAGREVAVIEPGHLGGTALALTGDPSRVGATFTTPARDMSWPLQSIRSFLDRRPEL